MADQNIFINPEEIESKFRSKYGMYKIMRYDSKPSLPHFCFSAILSSIL